MIFLAVKTVFIIYYRTGTRTTPFRLAKENSDQHPFAEFKNDDSSEYCIGDTSLGSFEKRCGHSFLCLYHTTKGY